MKKPSTNSKSPSSWVKKLSNRRVWLLCKAVNLAILGGVALYFFLLPGAMVARDIQGSLGEPKIPDRAFSLHQSLTPKFATWAQSRVASGVAEHLYLYDIPATEWPLFSAVFYLWSTERLQRAWEQDKSRAATAPKVYAKAAIEASRALLMDPRHHSWVRRHWGKGYMHRKNVFFRSLLIGGLTSYERLTKSGKYHPWIKEQLKSLAQSLDRSKLGVLDDYPGECYPIDVLAALGIMKTAGGLVGLEQKAFFRRALRAFQGKMLDRHGLPPYRVDEKSGAQLQPSRGIGNSHSLIFAPELWPRQARQWYGRYEKHFWQKLWWAHGFREFSRDRKGYQWLYDVDAGPVIAGFSTSGSAFGIAAARRNGRMDHAFTLSAQALAVSWPLPNGTLLGPRLLSSGSGAPYLGESGILFFLTTTPAKGVKIVKGGVVTGLVYFCLLFLFGVGGLLCLWVGLSVRRLSGKPGEAMQPWSLAGWAACGLLALTALVLGDPLLGFVAVACMQLLPLLERPATSSAS